MSDRASIRGARGTSRGGGGGGRGGHSNNRGAHDNSRGGSSGHHGGAGAGGAREAPAKKENILDLGKYADKRIIVKFGGGREVTGTLKGYDQLMNLVLDEVEETLRDEAGNTTTRPLGLLVARGTLLTSIAPVDGSHEVANPFLQGAGDDE